ncbi:MAG: class I SAM-dependent methyltransferase [Planctomycetota bacterium]
MDYISKCRGCGSERIELFFDLGQQPFANSLAKAKDIREKTYPLSLSWCSQCCLVQLNQTAEPDELFSNYVWVTGTSSTAKQYSVKFCDAVLARAQAEKNKGYVLELASNDGTFLKPFKNRGYKVLGVDPAQNIVEKAFFDGVPTKCGFFSEALAEEIMAEYDLPEIVFARNVLPHVANLHDFVKGVELCADNNTLVVIEVHYAKAILEQLHYDSVYHEHLCYFTLESIENLLRRYNLYIYDVVDSPISGGSIVLFIKKQRMKTGSSVQQYRNDEQEHKSNELSSWQEFSQRAFAHRDLLRRMLDEELKQGRTVVGYGASARSSTLLNFCGIDSKYISMIADQNPLKHKFFTAGTNILIDSPDVAMKSNPDTILLLAWNFREEIIAILRNRFGFEGKLIVPLPFWPKTVNMRLCHAQTTM